MDSIMLLITVVGSLLCLDAGAFSFVVLPTFDSASLIIMGMAVIIITAILLFFAERGFVRTVKELEDTPSDRNRSTSNLTVIGIAILTIVHIVVATNISLDSDPVINDPWLYGFLIALSILSAWHIVKAWELRDYLSDAATKENVKQISQPAATTRTTYTAPKAQPTRTVSGTSTKENEKQISRSAATPQTTYTAPKAQNEAEAKRKAEIDRILAEAQKYQMTAFSEYSDIAWEVARCAVKEALNEAKYIQDHLNDDGYKWSKHFLAQGRIDKSYRVTYKTMDSLYFGDGWDSDYLFVPGTSFFYKKNERHTIYPERALLPEDPTSWPMEKKLGLLLYMAHSIAREFDSIWECTFELYKPEIRISGPDWAASPRNTDLRIKVTVAFENPYSFTNKDVSQLLHARDKRY